MEHQSREAWPWSRACASTELANHFPWTTIQSGRAWRLDDRGFLIRSDEWGQCVRAAIPLGVTEGRTGYGFEWQHGQPYVCFVRLDHACG